MVSSGRLYYGQFFFSNWLVLSILGLRPDQSLKKQLFSLCAITFYIFPMVFHQLYQLFTSKVTLQSGVLQKTMGIFVSLTAYSTTYFNFETMKLLLSITKTEYEQTSNEEDCYMLEKYINKTKLYAYVVFGLFYGYIFSVITPCVVKTCLYFLGKFDSNQLSLIVPVNNVTIGGTQYFCLLIYQIIAVLIIVTVGSVSFTAFLLSVLYACYQFHVLIFKIQKPFERNLEHMGKDCFFRTPQDEWNWIIDIIKNYKNVTTYVQLLSNFSKISYLVALCFGMTLIVFDFLYILQLSKDLKNVAEIIESSFYISGSLITIYVNFYLGQELLNYSNVLFKELCQVPFYTLSQKNKKCLLFMIARSCKPSVLSIGGMFVSSHEIFAGVMRKAFSCAMVYISTQ